MLDSSRRRLIRLALALFALPLLAVLPACGVGGLGGGGGSGGGGGGGGGTILGTPEQQYCLQRVNAYRAMVGAPALVLDGQITSFAVAGSQELMADHSPHKHFIDASNAGTLFTTDGFRNTAGENQGDPDGWPPAASVDDQIDQILAAMWAEGPGSGTAHGHYNNMVNTSFNRLGVGLVVDGGGFLYFTNDFSG